MLRACIMRPGTSKEEPDKINQEMKLAENKHVQRASFEEQNY